MRFNDLRRIEIVSLLAQKLWFPNCVPRHPRVPQSIQTVYFLFLKIVRVGLCQAPNKLLPEVVHSFNVRWRYTPFEDVIFLKLGL